MSMIDERSAEPVTSREQALPGHILALVLPLVSGVAVAVAWRLLVPTAESLGDSQETAAAVDATLAGLGLVVGLVTGVLTLARPGPAPVRRVLLVMSASVVGAVIAWLLGDQLGTPALRAVGSAFVWPMTTSVTIMVGAILPWTSHRLESAPTSSDSGAEPGEEPGEEP